MHRLLRMSFLLRLLAGILLTNSCSLWGEPGRDPGDLAGKTRKRIRSEQALEHQRTSHQHSDIQDECPTQAGREHEKLKNGRPWYTWLQIALDGNGKVGIHARAVTKIRCPFVEEKKGSGQLRRQLMVVRAGEDPEFPMVCEKILDLDTIAVRFEAQESSPISLRGVANSLTVIGDTGCYSGWGQKPCEYPLWPFSQIIQQIVAVHIYNHHTPQIVHLGDFIYRQDKDLSGWEKWEVDFFQPADPLLQRGIWLNLRGNHEGCGKDEYGWRGWQRFLDPAPYDAESGCKKIGAAYVVKFAAMHFGVFDSAHASEPDERNHERPTDPALVSEYAEQLRNLYYLAQEQGITSLWLLTHRPFWGSRPLFVNGSPIREISVNPHLQGAFTAAMNSSGIIVPFALAGHIHALDFIQFADCDLPNQLILGTSGGALMPMGTTSILGGRKVAHRFNRASFGFGIIEPKENAWVLHYHAIPDELGPFSITDVDLPNPVVCSK